MNIHTRNVNTQPDQNAVEEALDILRNWVGHADETEIASLDADLLAQILPQQYPEFSASYNSDFTISMTSYAGNVEGEVGYASDYCAHNLGVTP